LFVKSQVELTLDFLTTAVDGYGTIWSSVCSDNWDIWDAHVACRQLGFDGALSYALSKSPNLGNEAKGSPITGMWFERGGDESIMDVFNGFATYMGGVSDPNPEPITLNPKP